MKKTVLLLLFLLLAIMNYCQQGLPRQKGTIVYKDSTKVTGWMEGLAGAESNPPRFVMLYSDSLAQVGRRIDARRFMKILLAGGGRFMAAFHHEIGTVTIASDALDSMVFAYQFMPLVVEGAYNVVKHYHGQHLDLNLLWEHSDTLICAHLEQQTLSGQTLPGSAKELPCEYLEELLGQYSFNNNWKQILENKLSDNNLSCEQKVAYFNIAVAETEKARQLAYQLGIDRWKFSLSGGASLAYHQLFLPLYDVFQPKGPVNGYFVTTDVGQRFENINELFGTISVGFKQHHFRSFSFNTLHLSYGITYRWPNRKMQYFFAGLQLGNFRCFWSEAFKAEFNRRSWEKDLEDRVQTSFGFKGGLITRRSNWEIGLAYTFSSAYQNAPASLSGYNFSVYGAKHFDFFLDKVKWWKKIF